MAVADMEVVAAQAAGERAVAGQAVVAPVAVRGMGAMEVKAGAAARVWAAAARLAMVIDFPLNDSRDRC